MERQERKLVCEKILKENHFQKFSVECHDGLVRLRVAPEEMERFLEPTLREEIVRRFKEIGFHFVSLDLCGYRSEGVQDPSP